MDIPELERLVIFELNQVVRDINSIEMPTIETKAQKIDIEKIYNEVKKDPINANFTAEPFSIIAAENGLDFNISINEAKEILKERKEEYLIPLKILYPEVLNNDLPIEAFPDLLGSCNTYYGTSNSNRKNNVALATEKINGKVLMPGEEFSFNYTVGQRTPAAGFKVAAVYSGGQVTTDYGGGICQVSSTLYDAALYANLEITNRTNHGFRVGYVPDGLDATVSWGAPDFCFKNNRNYAIKIIATCDGNRVYIDIYGLKQDNDYRVELTTNYIGTIYPSTVYQSGTNREPGTIIDSGSSGCIVEAYKLLYDQNGNLVDTIFLSRDRYNPHNRVIAN